MLDDEALLILGGIVLGFNVLVYFPLGIIFALKFWRLRKNTFILKRRPKLVLSIVIVAYIYILIGRTSTVLDAINIIEPNLYVDVITTNNGWIAVNFVGFRMWLLFYDYKRGQHLSSLRWRIKIDPKTLPWTLKYKYLSNLKYLIIGAIVHWTLIETIGVSVNSVYMLNYIESHL